MKGIQRILCVLSAVAMTAVLGGFSDGKTKNAASETEILSAKDAENDTGAKPIIGGELAVGMTQDLEDSLDPHIVVAAGTDEVLFNIFEGLVKPDADGNIIPAVASGWTVSEDGLIYTFTLREGITFHDGSPVTVGDVVYSLKRCAGLLDNGEPARVKPLTCITAVEAPDEQHVAVHLGQPNADLLAYLTAAVIPEHYDGQATRPVGTGPYRFVSRNVQENVVLERYEGYWGTRPYLDRITLKVIAPDAMIAALESGAVDFAHHLTVAMANQLSDRVKVQEGTSNIVQAIYLNNEYEPLKNEKVRQALCYATDRQTILDLVADGCGTPVGSSMYPAFAKYFDPSLADAYPYDPDKAVKLLAEAGYPNGFELEIKVPSNYKLHIDTAQVEAELLSMVGIRVKITEVDWNTWVSDVYMGHNYQATIIGFDASALTGRAMLERFTTGNAKNISAFSDAAYDEAFFAALDERDDARRTELYQTCQRILSERAANIYIQDPADMAAMRPDVDGYVNYPLYLLDLSTLHFVE